MFCRNCGAQNEDNAVMCGQCGTRFGGQSPAIVDSVPNYLVQAILVTLFCCLPFGIVAIVFASQVNSKLAGGDYEGAVKASDSARTWCWVSLLCGLIPMVLYVLLMVLGVLSGGFN